MPLSNIVHYIYEWVRQPLSSHTCEQYGIGGHNVAVRLNKEMRQICNDVLVVQPPPMIGGPGVVVEVDESVFRRRKVFVQVSK